MEGRKGGDAVSKPWEQEWRVPKGEDPCVVRADGADGVVAAYQYAFSEGPIPLDREDAEFIAAAPDMARALMGFLGACCRTGNPVRVCIEDRSVRTCPTCAALMALRKAGVLE